MQIWHDNSGKGGNASWFLKYIIVHDLQTREKFYFTCQDWFAVENSDGNIERCLFVALEEQKTQLKYLIEKQAKNYVFDNHLWVSVFIKPVQSSFSRLDRVTCCFVFHYISMLLNIMYYGTSVGLFRSSPSEINLGSVSFTMEQVIVGVLIDILTFFPLTALAHLYRKTRARKTQSNKLEAYLQSLSNSSSWKKSKLNEPKSHSKNETKAAEFKFPWWFKIVLYCFSFICMLVSVALILSQG